MKLSRREMGVALASPLLAAAPSPDVRVYIGTYTRGASKGIYSFLMNSATGALTPEGLAAETPNPSFLAVHPNGNFLYAANELDAFQGAKSGSITAFKINHTTGKLEKLNDAAAGGQGTCHVNVSRNGRFLVASNYGSGSCAAFALDADGKLGKRTAFHQHTGTSADPARQNGPHAHSVNFDLQNRHVIVADLGLDQVKVYKFNAETGAMDPNDPPFAKVKPGSGPRHFSFHPSGKFGYVINEMACSVTAFKWDAKKGVLTEIETVTTLPGPVEKGFSTAEVRVHPNGKFLYGSNRGHNSIAAFTIDGASGKLTKVENESTQGKTPRNFCIDPSGNFLIAANQDSDSIVPYKINPSTGALDPIGGPIATPIPVCVRYVRIRRV